MLFQPFVEKLTWHLDGQHVVGEPDRDDGHKPRGITRFRRVVLDDFKASSPYFSMALHPILSALVVPFWDCKYRMKKVNKKFFLLLTLQFFYRIIRGFLLSQ